jgi:hypothetical protein
MRKKDRRHKKGKKNFKVGGRKGNPLKTFKAGRVKK